MQSGVVTCWNYASVCQSTGLNTIFCRPIAPMSNLAWTISAKEMESKIAARSASKKNGVRWSKDFETHQTFRAAVFDQIGIVIPDSSELARSDLATGSCHLLPERALDALLLHKFVAHHVCGDWENLSGYFKFFGLRKHTQTKNKQHTQNKTNRMEQRT